MGSNACSVKVSTLAVVGAQFAAGINTQPQPTLSKSVAVEGSYSGDGGQGFPMTLFVAPGGGALLNISVPTISYSCTQGVSTDLGFGILKTAIRPGGAFTAKGSESGVLIGLKVKFTYTIAGRFSPATAAVAATGAGTWREDVAYSSGASCTSNTVAWKATRDAEPLEQKVVVAPGNYSGDGGQGFPITFSVAPGGTALANISVPAITFYCTPSGTTGVGLAILKAGVSPDGSFTSTTSQTGVLNGVSAKFIYTFSAYFEGPTRAGAATMAGMWREDIVFASGTTQVCTSNNVFWQAKRVS